MNLWQIEQNVVPQSDGCEKNCCDFGYADHGRVGVPVVDIDHSDDNPNHDSDEKLTLNDGM